MNQTTIPWALNPDGTSGYTSNPITGCLNRTPEGLCLSGLFPCYAYRLAHGRVRPLYLANKNIAPVPMTKGTIYGYMDMLREEKALKDPFYPRFWERRLEELTERNTRKHKPQGRFICDMGDLFGIGVPENWTARVLDVLKGCWQDRHYLLTKQPQNLARWSPFPDNCWIGITATTAPAILEATNYLFEHKLAKTQYISIEPLLSLNTSDFVYPLSSSISKKDFDWLIIGACTGTGPDMIELVKRRPELTLMRWGHKWTAQPKIEWVQELIQVADQAGIPIFLKNNLKPLFNKYIKSGEDRLLKALFGDNLYFALRQEMPEVSKQ